VKVSDVKFQVGRKLAGKDAMSWPFTWSFASSRGLPSMFLTTPVTALASYLNHTLIIIL